MLPQTKSKNAKYGSSFRKKDFVAEKINNTCEIFSKMQNLRYGDESDLSDETK